MKKYLILLLCVMLTVSFSACGGTPDQGSSGGDDGDGTLTIGVSLLTREHVFYNTFEDALVSQASKYGFELIIQDARQDSNMQTNQVQDFITQGVDAIILCPVDSAGIGEGIKLAVESGIAVFTADIQADDATGVTAHVAIDNYAGGKLAAEYANDLLGGEGEVAVIGYDEVSSCVDRSEGFIDGLEAFPGLVLVDNQNSSGNAEKGADIMQNMMLAHPNLKLVFGNGDPWALTAAKAVNDAQKDILVIGFDGSDEAVDEIKKGGPFVASVWDSPAQMGEMTIDVIKDYFDGKVVSPVTAYPPRMLDINVI